MSKQNPYEVLRLDPSASEEEIVRQAGRLRQRAPDEAGQNALRQAVQQLTRSAEERLLWSLLSHPAPCYQWPAVERLAASARRPPPGPAPASCPQLDLAEVQRLLRETAADGVEQPCPCFEDQADEEGPEELARQTAELLWQSLLVDPRG